MAKVLGLLLDLSQSCLEIYPRLCKNEQLGKLGCLDFGLRLGVCLH